jgi:hypothetical protein
MDNLVILHSFKKKEKKEKHKEKKWEKKGNKLKRGGKLR